MPTNEEQALAIGGPTLVRFFDLIQAEQRKRWNCPDWRDTKIIDADLVNWRDVASALNRIILGVV